MKFFIFGIMVAIYLFLGIISAAIVPIIINEDFDNVYGNSLMLTISVVMFMWPIILILVILYCFGKFLEQRARSLYFHLRDMHDRLEEKIYNNEEDDEED